MNEEEILYMEISNFIDMIQEVLSKIGAIEEEGLKKEVEKWDLDILIEEISEELGRHNENLDELSEQLKSSLKDIIIRFSRDLEECLNHYYENEGQRFKAINLTLNSLYTDLKRVGYLSLITNKNVILIGGNGSGKSSFASFLKESFMSNVVVIPAQKFLFYNNSIRQLHLTNKEDINKIQNDDFIKKGRLEGNQASHVATQFMSDLSSVFSQLVTVICNQQIEQQHKLINHVTKNEEDILNEREETILYKLNNLWQSLIPDIIFDVDTTNRALVPIKNGESYSINSMSDGEKSILYYTCQVLLAEENSFIIVDEPETFLNASNFSRLWDKLEVYRNDCRFIYISHVIDFIISRANSEILWCKSFTFPSYWDIKNINYEGDIVDEFPKELLTEILGARRPILFCEGEKDKDDYFVYSSIFGSDTIVCPVGGHQRVIQYTRAYNNSPLLNSNRAYGIIDSDLMSETQISNYESEGIYSFPFNEIEMIFLTEEVIERVLDNNFSPADISLKLARFKRKFFEAVEEDKSEIIGKKLKKHIDSQLSNYRVKEELEAEIILKEAKNWLDSLKLEEIEHSMLEELNHIIEAENYIELLKVSPLKKKVSKSIANKELDSRFEEKALNRIRLDKDLRENLKEKYFSQITFE